MANREIIRHAASQVLEFLFPGRCLICGGRLLLSNVQPFYPICGSCLNGLEPIKGSRCRICSRALISETRICTRCRERNYHFSENRSLFDYREGAKEIIYPYKFRGRRRLGLLIADLIAPLLNDVYDGIPVVPVPYRPRRRRSNGFNHIELVCRNLRRRHGIRIYCCLIRKKGIPQKSLNFEERLRNLSGRIFYKENNPLPRPLSEAVLIDDIFTTGATADECARVLKNVGVETVHVVSFALD